MNETCLIKITEYGNYAVIRSDPMVLSDFLPFLEGDSGVWGLKKNFALLELLERLQNGATNQSGVAEEALKGIGEVRLLLALLVFCSC